MKRSPQQEQKLSSDKRPVSPDVTSYVNKKIMWKNSVKWKYNRAKLTRKSATAIELYRILGL